MILFDCERLKHSHTGLYHFCEQLGTALQRHLKDTSSHKELGFYVPTRLIGKWGNDCKYLSVNPLHKIFFSPTNIELWHSAYQLSHYMPKKVPILQTVHDLNYLYEPLSRKQKQRRIDIIKRNIGKTSRIVTISQATKKELLTHFDVGDTPIQVIYNGCNIYQGPIIEPKTKPNRPFLFSVSIILPKKNLQVLPCLLQGNDYELILAGINNDAGYVRDIYNEAKKWGVSDRVHLIGAIPEAEKHWYLRNCTAFLFPSIAEGFGLPVIEAMQYGKPVFLSQHTCLPEIGGDYAYYFNYEFDRYSMQNEFLKGMEDFNQGGKKAEDIKTHAQTFSWEKAAAEYWNLYEEMLGL